MEKKSNDPIDREHLQQVYDLVIDFQEKSHLRNQKRIKIGLRCLYIIPAVFLFLLMVTESSKIIFLALWILSLFVLAIYLIAIEYMDYNLQRQIRRIEDGARAPFDGLIGMERLNERIGRFESHVDRYETAVEIVEGKVDQVTAAARGRLLQEQGQKTEAVRKEPESKQEEQRVQQDEQKTKQDKRNKKQDERNKKQDEQEAKDR